MSALSDLAALEDVKVWLSGSAGLGSSDDLVIGRLITGVSGNIYSELSRQFVVRRVVTERYDGRGGSKLLLANYPVTLVSSVAVGATSVPTVAAGSTTPSGFRVAPWSGLPPGGPQYLELYGYTFNIGSQNVAVTYAAGYAVVSEAATVPSVPPYAVSPAQPFGPWAADGGVTYAGGAALTAALAAPAAGQYAPPPAGVKAAGAAVQYTFSASDAGAGVLLTYGYVPSALNAACIEWVAERYRYRGRIGQSSQSVAGNQTASYNLKTPDYVCHALQPFKNVVPWGSA